MAANLQKLKLLYIAKMLVEETDAVAGLTMAQILERLEAHGITAERKSVYRDIESLAGNSASISRRFSERRSSTPLSRDLSSLTI